MASVVTSHEIGTNGEGSRGTGPGRARLNGLAGVGSLLVWRGQHGQVLALAGSWRLELNGGDGAATLEDLRRAMQEGRSVRFEGRLLDPGRAGAAAPDGAGGGADAAAPAGAEAADGVGAAFATPVDTTVRISSIGTYRYLLHPRDPESPAVDVTMVNFRPVDDGLVS